MVEECNEITFQWTYDNMNLQRLIILTLGLAVVTWIRNRWLGGWDGVVEQTWATLNFIDTWHK